MAEGVVDRLEPVEVEHQHRERRIRAGRLGERRAEAVVQAGAVVEAGERLLPGERRAADMLGHVLEGEGEAAGGEGHQRRLDAAVAVEGEARPDGPDGAHRLGKQPALRLRGTAGRQKGGECAADRCGAGEQRRRAGIGEGNRAGGVEQEERGGHLGEGRLERRRDRDRGGGEGGHAAEQRPVEAAPAGGPAIERPAPQRVLKGEALLSVFARLSAEKAATKHRICRGVARRSCQDQPMLSPIPSLSPADVRAPSGRVQGFWLWIWRCIALSSARP